MTQVSTSDVGSPYALDNDKPTAARILDCLSTILDDNSMFHLDEAMSGPVVGGRCLELGAGNGSIAAWLAISWAATAVRWSRWTSSRSTCRRRRR